ncbi:class I SAM-dependent methyltransferase [Synechococcus sp. M16CYN]
MTTTEQVEAYAAADFSSGDVKVLVWIEQLLAKTGPLPKHPSVVDLGCGPGNITFRLAELLPSAKLIGIDGSDPMLAIARRRAGSHHPCNIQFHCLLLQEAISVFENSADLIVSNSLLHHLQDPSLLWKATRAIGKSGCRVLHRDLCRPSSLAEVHCLQQRQLPNAPSVLVQDFTASLIAAYTPEEVTHQLRKAEMKYLVATPEEDRYLVVSGLVN